ncbi:LRR receptor-like serine/threonine-protein kinase RPK2 [Lycium ferocissimum]|uniref:LRR receptor-like serine/threonine-protein kinase RPK2 n=1 Tax=Lycium ferocissimum TaxID=112874 RepID=UPI002815B6C9|nr:LRR receptor-like serine/threonine-protein kinase RPK2 [Lycium ferocissimum]
MQLLGFQGMEKLVFSGTLILFLMAFVFSCFPFSASQELFSEKMALLELKNSFGDPFGILSSWRSNNSSYCSWYGISCNSNSRISELRIRGNKTNAASCTNNPELALHAFGVRRKSCLSMNGKLVGNLSPIIGFLKELRVLSLPFNDLTGEIPDQIWGLKNLDVLDLEGNSFQGHFSSYDFSGLRKLRVVNLGFNRIVGRFPPSLAKCRFLSVLNLAGNQINDVIPGFIGGLEKLRVVNLSFNRLLGRVPVNLRIKCANLEHLDLSFNFLQGEIPRVLGKCSHLRTLLLTSNAFSGVIPSELGSLERLEVLDVSRNSLDGSIPPQLGNCLNLSILVLSSLFNVHGNALGELNFFEGSIPSEITMLPKLEILWAPGANLRGHFPNDWGHCDSLKVVNLAHNFFMGKISGAFHGCHGLIFLNISSNRLFGNLGETLPVPCMTLFDVSRNLMSGPIPQYNTSVCPHDPKLIQTYNPAFPYLSFLAYKTCSESPLPFPTTSYPVIHNLGGNSFTGGIPLLPMTHESLGKRIDYAFLAGGNKLTGLSDGNLFGNCDGLGGMTINLSSNEISGQVPEYICSVCRSLKSFDASRNNISGSLPKHIGHCKSLIVLELSWNKLQGQIPADLHEMQSLEVLDLSSNSLSGNIPEGLTRLVNLTVLLLNNNTLTGEIPSGLESMTALHACDISFNNLSFPSDNKMITQCSFLGNSFLSPTPSTLSNVSQSYAVPPQGPQSKNGKRGLSLSSIETVVAVSATAIIFGFAILVAFCMHIKKGTPNPRIEEASESPERSDITVFKDVGVVLTYDKIVQATRHFSWSKCIGNGGFGSTYKAEVSSGIILAVKRLSVERSQGLPQFNAEINSLRSISHPNLITLIGYYASEADMFLIYNYLPGGNLEKFIQDRSNRIFDFKVLHKIASDISLAISYLHDHCVPRIVHRDVKPSNILLDNELNAYLSDFGLSRIMGTETCTTTKVAGTFGYVAPEYALTSHVSDKADVYSYGIVLLELLSDKRALDPSFSVHENGFNIVSWASMLFRDDKIQDIFYSSLWEAGPEEKLVDMLHLALLCTTESLSARPRMRQVVGQLKKIAPLVP